MQIGGSLCRSSQTKTVHIITRHHGIDRTYIHLARITRFHITFNQCLQTHHNVFEPFDFGQVINEIVHVTFRGGQFRFSSISRPEIFIAHHGIDILHFPPLLLEYLGRHFFKSIFRVSGNPSNHEPTSEHIQFAKHIIGCLYPFTGRQSTEQLGNLHVFHEVHIRLLREIQNTLLQTVSRIGHDIQMPCKAKVLRIVGYKSQMETFILLHI